MISSDNSKISTLQDEIKAKNATIVSLQGQIQTDVTKIKLLNATVVADALQIATLQSQVSTYQSQISTLNGQVSSLQGQVTSLQTQVSSLQIQVSLLQSITSLSKTTNVVSNITVTETASDLFPTIASYIAQYAGYLVVSGSTNAPNGFFLVDQTIAGTEYSGHFEYGPVVSSSGTLGYYVSGSFSLAIPVSAGSLTLHFASNDNTYDSATVTVTFVY
jgi:TolA-binding protein